jgi:hypothetical protein
MKTKIWSAAIDCDTGDTLLYAAATRAGIEKEVADYCRKHWDEDEMDGDFGEFESDINTIEAYFEAKGDESCTIDEADLDLSTIPAVAALIARNAELENALTIAGNELDEASDKFNVIHHNHPGKICGTAQEQDKQFCAAMRDRMDRAKLIVRGILYPSPTAPSGGGAADA